MRNKILGIKRVAERNKVLITNFSYLSILQVINLLLPLVTYPYLIRVLGKETYGLVVFAQAVVGYLAILVSFGFNISATREISVHRDDKEKLSEIVSSVLIIKSILFILSFFILGVLIKIIPSAHGLELLFILSMWVCVYDIVFPIWYFQGIEKMKYITYITLISRLTFFGLIFVFVRHKSDYLYVPMLFGLGTLITGSFALYIIFKVHQIKLKKQKFDRLKYYLVDSIPIFISNVSISLYVNTNKVVIGMFLGMEEVAYYDLAEKITTVLKMPQTIISQSLFPKISREKDINFVRRVFVISMIINIFLFLAILIASKYIIILLGGKQMIPAQIVVCILSLTIPLIAMSNVFGLQILVPFGFNKAFSRVIWTSGLFYVIQVLLIWFTIGFSINNISIVTVNTELFVTAYMFYNCKKNNLWK